MHAELAIKFGLSVGHSELVNLIRAPATQQYPHRPSGMIDGLMHFPKRDICKCVTNDLNEFARKPTVFNCHQIAIEGYMYDRS
jgi:hypothetical protein